MNKKAISKVLLTLGILLLIVLAIALYIIISKRIIENLIIRGL
ncbi:MAG: hypothetical protein QW423_01225 [Candidatus Aenigmatarchaeota archaeon]